MSSQSVHPKEWIIPLLFVVSGGWVVWHMPAFILDLIPPDNESLFAQISALHLRKDVVSDAASIFGGYTDLIDWGALISLPIIFALGMRSIRCTSIEYPDWRAIDRAALFIGRVTMVMIILMTLIMLYEVFLRYIVEAPTLWANEVTLWIAGFVFMLSGIYAMQQRCHIRIFLLYDMVPRWMQRVFDTICVLLLVIFTFFLVYGSYHQVFVTKFYKWEMFGTAFDPPIPATIQPAILITLILIALQSVINLICDWNQQPTTHSTGDDIDEEDIAMIKKSLDS